MDDQLKHVKTYVSGKYHVVLYFCYVLYFTCSQNRKPVMD